MINKTNKTKVSKYAWNYAQKTVEESYSPFPCDYMLWNIVLKDRWDRMDFDQSIPNFATFERLCIFQREQTHG